MKLSDYMSRERFPNTSQSGLSANGQLMIDAYNYDQLNEYLEAGGQLDQSQQARWEELKVKRQHMAEVIREVRGLTAGGNGGREKPMPDSGNPSSH